MRLHTELKTAILLIDLARCGSIGKTAALHGLAPSTVLRHLRTFEAACGKKLLAASAKGTSLTEAGLRLAARIEKETSAALAPIKRPPHESLSVYLDARLQCPAVWTLLFRWAADQASEVRLTSKPDEADIRLLLAADQEPTLPLNRIFTASPGYLANAGIPYTRAELSAHSLVVCEDDVALFSACKGHKMLIVPTLAAGLSAAENGLGLLYGITKTLVASQRQAGSLSVVPLDVEDRQSINIASSIDAMASLRHLLMQFSEATQ